ncbi:PREDICTED: craniofacial development protein 1-like, partial [Mesitornis unicolor]|uniref:craniofacial development protein 1-like n=1 Tax=Mesitornis unicolor TaxID=54374 RepID=UPI00052897B4
KKKKGGLLLEPDEKEEEKPLQNEEKEEEEEEVDNVEQVELNSEEEEKKKEDALWARFLSDVGQKPKAGAATQVTQAAKAEEEKSGSKLQEKPKESEKSKDSGKVTITKVFDFAGEEVRVTKEVDSTSKEAKSFLKQQEKRQAAPAPASLPTVSG